MMTAAEVERVYVVGEREPVALVRQAVPCVRCGLPTTSDVGVILYSPICTDCQYDFLADMEHEGA